ncbi:MAG: hypothetical protein MO852_14235, partial [Candidatus Devosia euplotis]|nr:hypothetical protein [Candidatus Devosia euplotis]
GRAVVTVKVAGRALIWQYVLCALALLAAFVVLALGGFAVLNTLAHETFVGGGFDAEIFFQQMQGSLITLVAIIFGYLLIIGTFTLMIELFVGLGYWRLIALGATIAGGDTLGDVRARAEDRALAGEGLADALNVGAY